MTDITYGLKNALKKKKNKTKKSRTSLLFGSPAKPYEVTQASKNRNSQKPNVLKVTLNRARKRRSIVVISAKYFYATLKKILKHSHCLSFFYVWSLILIWEFSPYFYGWNKYKDVLYTAKYQGKKIFECESFIADAF